MAEVDFSLKPFSNLTWAVTLLKEPMNVIMVMNLINNKLGAFWCISTVHKSHYSLVETSYGQLNIKSFYSALSDYSGQQSPHEYH